MPNYQEAAESARRLSRTLADLATLAGVAEQLADADRQSRTLATQIEQRKAELANATLAVAGARSQAEALLADAKQRAEAVTADAGERAARTVELAQAEALRISESLAAAQNVAEASLVTANARLTELDAAIADRETQIQKLDNRLALARSRAEQILKG
jgi:hypothetical protein